MQRKVLTKLNTSLWFKKHPINGHGRNLPQHKKGHIGKSLSKHYSQWCQNVSISSKISIQTMVPTLIPINQYSFVSQRHSNQRRKWERMHIEKEEIHLSLIADDLFLFTEDPKDRTRKLLELINEFCKAQDIKLIHRNPLHTYSTTRKIRKRN